MFLDQRRGEHILTIWDVDVSASFWYGVLMGFIIVLWPVMGNMEFTAGVLIAVVVTLSLLAHEFGHAFVAKRQGLGPSVLLHAFGGFCFTDREAGSDGADARQVIAGPVVSLLLAGVAALVYTLAPGVMVATPVLQTVVPALLWFNLGWALFNLVLPIWPYDGGRLLHLLVRQFRDEKQARTWTLNASIFAMIPVGIIGVFAFGSLIVAFLAFFVVMDNIQRLRSSAPLVRRKSDRSKNQASSFHEELLGEAEEAMDQQNWQEAARVAHQMRSVGSMPEKMLEKVWTILGVATMRMGNYEEALSYLKRAPENSEVNRAVQRCEEALEQREAQPD